MKSSEDLIKKLKHGVKINDKNDSKKYVFVIMSFSGNGILESYYEEAIEPTVIKFGSVPV